VGYSPDYYPVIRAARYLGVAPWVLIERPDGWIWQMWALVSEGAELEAQSMLHEQAKKSNLGRRSGMGRKSWR